MNLAISNFAWDNKDSVSFFSEMKKTGLSKIECVLTKIKDWSELTINDIIDYKKSLDYSNITPYSIQSLFYNVKCEKITEKKVVLNHFNKLIEYSKILGVKILVFGSPNIRKFEDNWENVISDIFISVDNMLNQTGITLVIEPNASIYGGDFFKTPSEIIKFIKTNRLNNIRTMIDTHNLELENLDPTIEFLNNFDYISHIHVSEKKLQPITNNKKHKEFSDAIKLKNYKGVITYEILKCDSINESIKDFVKIYQNGVGD